jgi:hypothetical protein
VNIRATLKTFAVIGLIAASFAGCGGESGSDKPTAPVLTPETTKDAIKSVEAGRGAMKPAGIPKK